MLEQHQNAAYDLTGDEALTYGDAARILSEELGRPIGYSHPGILKFALEERARGVSWPFIAVMVGIYSLAKLGRAGRVTPTTRELLKRPATTLRQFIHDYKVLWMPRNPLT